MSLLDINDNGLLEIETNGEWNDYENLKEVLNNNLLEIDIMLDRCKYSDMTHNITVSDYNKLELCHLNKVVIGVSAALIWWTLVVNWLSIYFYLEDKNRLRICSE